VSHSDNFFDSMEEILIATPLKNVTQPYEFSNGISVRRVEPILWKQAIVNGFISENEKGYIAKTDLWLTTGKSVDDPVNQGNELYEKLRWAMFGVQIICPSGGKNLYLKFHHTKGGFDNIGSNHPPELNSTIMGRITFLRTQRFAEDFEAVYEGINRAFTDKIIRLQNPILLLEHGQQITNVPLSTLFWVMGLDMLFMAGGDINRFEDRISGFLGPDTLILPFSSITGQQPATRVKDVLRDLYELRNKLAHGLEIPKTPYRQKYLLLGDTSGASVLHGVDYSYLNLMHESALYLLCKSLRKIFLDELVDTVKDESRWKLHLKIGARLQQQTP
jgi:hypothetical protein